MLKLAVFVDMVSSMSMKTLPEKIAGQPFLNMVYTIKFWFL